MVSGSAAERLAYRPNEAAVMLGCSRDLVFQLMRANELRSYRVGAARFISVDALREFVARREATAGGKA